MYRRDFIYNFSLLSLGTMNLSILNKLSESFDPTDKMPALFVGHGNPMNAISNNRFTIGWEQIVKQIPKPKAILCVSAHWETRGTHVTMNEHPKTIHDFYGFPQALFDVEYPAPGSPEMAKETQGLVDKSKIESDYDWGLDHGTWSILVKMYPEANIPTFQLSLDRTKDAQYHYEIGKQLYQLRKKGVLIMGSGNIVHNLRYASFAENPVPYDWALEFDETVKNKINSENFDDLINYQKLGISANLSVPTPEHYLPMLYILGLKDKNDSITFFNEEMAFASGSMRSFIIA